jgi:antitoxin component YwqK of YwqJK toxin-antitoxin module
MKRMGGLVTAFAVMVAAGYGATLIAQSGTVAHRTKLAQATEIQGYACAKDYAWFYSDGKLQRCTTSREIAVGVAQVQRGSIIELLPDGRPSYVMMLHDAAVGEVECSGGNWLLGPSEGAMVVLYPSGKLKQCWLAKEQVVQGVPCMRGGFLGLFGDGARRDGGAKFYESGKLESCTLAKDYGGKRRGDHFQQGQ